jgi:cell wall assembly regulator SMI1
MTSSTRAETSNNTNDLINRVTTLWNQLNDALAYAPHFQNTTRKGVSEECIKQIESKLNLTLPAEIRAAISVHDGRVQATYGMNFHLATTDFMPIAQ